MLLHTILPEKSKDQVKKSIGLTLYAVHQTNTVILAPLKVALNLSLTLVATEFNVRSPKSSIQYRYENKIHTIIYQHFSQSAS